MNEPLKQFHPKSWLWWLALFIVIIGGLVVFLLSQQPMDSANRTAISVSIVVTLISSGLCIICATSEWWINR